MNYELAKQLKDAGFPYPTEKHYAVFGDKWCLETPNATSLRRKDNQPDDTVAAPTLEELIEACGGEYGALLRVPTGMWQSMGGKVIQSKQFDIQGEYHLRFLASTPTEAVAKLWLALNKKI